MPGKLARPVRRGAVRKRTRELREPRRTAYPTVSGVCQCCVIRHPGIAIQLVDDGNTESAVRFLSEWVSDGEAEARRYLAGHTEPDGTSFIAVSGSGAVGYVAIVWESAYAGFRSRGIPLVH